MCSSLSRELAIRLWDLRALIDSPVLRSAAVSVHLFPFAFCLPPDCIKDDCQHTCAFTSLQQLEVSAFPKRRILTEIVDPRPSSFSCLFSNTSFHSCSVFPYIINILMTWNVRTILLPVQVSKTLYAICFLNSKSSKPLPRYKSPHFQNKAKWRTYSILMLPKFNFLHECFLHSHALQQRPWISYEWLVSNSATTLIAQLLWNRDVFKWKCFYLILLNTQIHHLSLSEQNSLPNQACGPHPCN